MATVGRFSSLSIDDYRSASGVELGRRVVDGALSPVQLAECALEIAAGAEPTINAYASLLRERALRQAAEREADVRAGRVRGPLHGVPIAVKDNMLYEGEPTGNGSRTSQDDPATTSAPMVARLLEGGVVVIGKTTTPEFGWKGTGSSPRTGVTRNPWDPRRTSGGSSAGSGATVASGAVPAATGTDAGGSVRIPASFCGVVGLKPTLGAIPLWPGTVTENLSHAGVLARTVDDTHALLRATRGPDPRDPQSFWSSPPPAEGRHRLRIGVVRHPFGIAPDEDVADVVETGLRAIVAAAVADHEEVALPAELPRAIFDALWVTGRGLGFRDLVAEHAAVMDPGLVRLTAVAADYDLADYFTVMQLRREFNAAMFGAFEEVDLLVMPTMPITAFDAEAEVPEGGDNDAPLPWVTWTPYTYPFNISGQPAVSIPCGRTAAGMPVGLQVVGPWGHDERVLDFARCCEGIFAQTEEIDTVTVLGGPAEDSREGRP